MAMNIQRPALAAWPQDLIGAILGGKRDLRQLAARFMEWATHECLERYGTEELREGYRRILAAAPERQDVVAKRVWFEVGAKFEQFAISSSGSAFFRGRGPQESPDRARVDNVAHGIWLTTLDQSVVGTPGGALQYFAAAGLTWGEQATRLIAMIAGPWEETEKRT